MKYSKEQIEQELKKLKGWRLEKKEILREFHFRNFSESIEFVDEVAKLAEKYNHHPDILIKYDTVRLNLTTHNEGGLTEKDFNLAKHINKLVRE